MATLFEQVKRKLNITWEDEETDARVNEIIESAVPDLIHRLGITDNLFDFSIASKENTLFKNYCLYEWNHCLNEFWDNYKDDISDLRRKYEVIEYQKSEGEHEQE